MPRPDWIEVGRISRPHGVRGEVRIIPDSDNPERFAPGSVLHARPARPGLAGLRVGEPVRLRLTIDTVRGDGDFPIVAFREVADRDAAEGLRGYLLEVQSSQLPSLDDDEYYPFDLIGLEVRDPYGGVTGRVVDIVDSPAHAILVVSLGSRTPGAGLTGREASDSEAPSPGAPGPEPTDPGMPVPGTERMVPFVLEAVPTVAVGEGYLVIEPRYLEEAGVLGGWEPGGGSAADAAMDTGTGGQAAGADPGTAGPSKTSRS
jgi:16S rRNA processing protein RimM